jgi:hypothetical protein
LIATKPIKNDLFNYYKERAELYFHMDKYQGKLYIKYLSHVNIYIIILDAIKDIDAMKELKDLPADTKLIKWYVALYYYFCDTILMFFSLQEMFNTNKLC